MQRRWIFLGAGLLLLALAFLVDGALDRWCAAHRVPELELFAKVCSRFLAWHWLVALAGTGVLVTWIQRRRAWLPVLCAMIVASSLGGLSADFLRGMTGRTRPYAPATQGWYGLRQDGRWLIGKHAYNSFPSGHVAAITGIAFPLLLWRRRLGLTVLPLVALVAAARVYLGAHHLSDVVGGALLGSIAAMWVWRRISSGAWSIRGFLGSRQRE